MTLTVAMITLNEEKNLERTLKSVQDFADEIVIVDSGSTDRTEEIAKKIAELKNMSYEDVVRITNENTRKVFKML